MLVSTVNNKKENNDYFITQGNTVAKISNVSKRRRPNSLICLTHTIKIANIRGALSL